MDDSAGREDGLRECCCRASTPSQREDVEMKVEERAECGAFAWLEVGSGVLRTDG